MECNVGKIDQGLRLIVAALLVGIGFQYGLWWLYIVAAVPLLTAVFRFCPAYTVLKVSTCGSCCTTSKGAKMESCCAGKAPVKKAVKKKSGKKK